MLILSRKKGEQIVIGEPDQVLTEPITLCVVEIRGDKIRLGIEAPREIAVHRREVYDAIERKKGKEAAA